MPDLHLIGLPGPLLSSSGLERGSAASAVHTTRPRDTALAVIDLCRAILAHGKPVAVLPPQERPHLPFLRACGFSGDDATIVAAAARDDGPCWRLATDAAATWAADAASVVPAADAPDQRLHLAVANLGATPARQLEAAARVEQLRAIFPDRNRVVVHAPLPAVAPLADTGAADHHRAATGGGRCHLLAHGRSDGLPSIDLPSRHAPRRSREAAHAIARLTGMPDVLHVRLHPAAIDAGAAHLDQVATGSRDRLLLHEHALIGQAEALDELRRRVPGVRTAHVAAHELPLDQAMRCGLLASCLLRTPQGHILLAPAACAEGAPRRVIDRLLGEGFLAGAGFANLGSDLEAGGVSALRLRVPLTAADLHLVHPGVLVDRRKLDTLAEWVKSCYREDLHPADLADPQVLVEAQRALDLLTRLLGLGSRHYAFQAVG